MVKPGGWELQVPGTLGTNISPPKKKHVAKMVYLFPRWDTIVPWRVYWIFSMAMSYLNLKVLLSYHHLFLNGSSQSSLVVYNTYILKPIRTTKIFGRHPKHGTKNQVVKSWSRTPMFSGSTHGPGPMATSGCENSEEVLGVSWNGTTRADTADMIDICW